MDIGEKIKMLRIKNNLTQQELANRCELSKGFISQLERNLSSPSIATLKDLLETLGTNLKEFFSHTEHDKIVFKKEDVFVQENDDVGQVIHWIVPSAQKNLMEPILVKLAPGGRSDDYGPHPGEVFGYVIQGNIKLSLGGNNHRIKSGESFYYEAEWAYYIENTSSREAVVLWVSNPPNF